MWKMAIIVDRIRGKIAIIVGRVHGKSDIMVDRIRGGNCGKEWVFDIYVLT